MPECIDDVQEIVRIAASHRICLHPVSTGRNWGYGTANSSRNGCAIVDLSHMCRIRSFDAELGLATVEPGVTQGALRAWLDDRELSFMVPTTGAGPGCSIVGNALERGYGITPINDHFGAVTALEAVLPDGSVYQSPMADANAFCGFKWGIGPYVDGLFSQGQIGIVTSMTIALARRPQRIEAFYFWIDNDSQLEALVDTTRRILQDAGSNIGGINLMSAARFLAMSGRYPDGYDRTGPLPESVIQTLAQDAGAAAWMGIGAVYGSNGHAAATREVIRSALNGLASRVVFMTSPKAHRLATLLNWVPGARADRLRTRLKVMQQGLALLEGVPAEVALPLAYWKSGEPPACDLNPSRDRCGLFWYAPVIPLKGADARRFVDLARDVCARYGFETPVTFTSLSERSFDCTLPLLFDGTDVSACARAEACWEALFRAGLKTGYMPYRVHVEHGSLIASKESPYWRTVERIRKAIDPFEMLSPGRWTSDAAASSPPESLSESMNDSINA
nr:FAD-binding oxidoreductase [Paraburkholderia sp. Ac-20347]